MENNIEKNIDQNEEMISAEQPAVATAKKPFPWWIIAIAAAVIAVLVLVILLLPKEPDPTYSDYSVTVIDGIGNPVSNVIVKFTDKDGNSKTRVTDKAGLATYKNALDCEYTVTLEQGYSDAVNLNGTYSLNKENKTMRIIVRDGKKTDEIFGDVADGTFAYNVGIGSYNIPMEENSSAYFVFYAQSSGTYKVTLSSSDESMTVGYYGIPMFVQSTHRGDADYDGKTFEFVVNDINTPYVIGIKGTKSVDAGLTIERTGDAPFDPQFAPWTIVKAKGEIEKCNLSAGAVLKDLDVTDPSLSVTLGNDGYYYTSDGKLVYLRIDSITTAQYLDVSIAFIAGLVDKNFGQNFGGYVYNGDEFVGKYSYNEMLASYFEKCSGSGVYPLTAELAEAIKVHGNSTGWWNPNAANYLFSAVNEITENAWLFLCCTAE